MKKYPFYSQEEPSNSAYACLQMVSKYYGKFNSLSAIKGKTNGTNGANGNYNSLIRTADAVGFRTMVSELDFDKIDVKLPLPLIMKWEEDRYAVVYKVTKKQVVLADPVKGLLKFDKADFMKTISKNGSDQDQQQALILQPKPEFYTSEGDKTGRESDGSGFMMLYKYLIPYKKEIVQLLFGMVAGSLLMLVLPFLTQAVVDVGIANQNIMIINVILIAMLVLYFSRTVVDFIRAWIMLHVGTRINISIISDFLIKLMKLPIPFFDGKKIGDILQRIGDHRRIETFLTGATLDFVFSFFNLLVLGIVLAIYHMSIFLIFLAGSILYITWVLIFMKKRRVLDFKRFDQMSENQSTIIQLVKGMQENRLHNCENEKRWEWERIQVRLFGINIKSLTLNQYQTAGSVFIYEASNIFITYFAATSVIAGEMTLGMMLSIQFIMGQLNGPINSIIRFIYLAQDAKMSLERLNTYHNVDDEELSPEKKVTQIQTNSDIHINQLSFKYDESERYALKNIDMKIPTNKTTAIVGTSGSGKTTLIKLLLKFYKPTSGGIKLGATDLGDLSNVNWRAKCGVVLQDGFIYTDTIAQNIVVKGDVDPERLEFAIRMANIQEHIQALPNGYNTLLENGEDMLSQGQKQRLLIARAVYKNPDFLFFDEATNALDAKNERVIMHNLNDFTQGKTVVVVAHRLSTVRNADQIVVLDQGEIVESGNHQELVDKKGFYFSLIKNQLELGA